MSEVRPTSDASHVALRRGRKSMSGEGVSPQVKVRVPIELRERASRAAEHEGKSISDLAREGLEMRVRTMRPEAQRQRNLHIAVVAKLMDSGLAPWRELIERNLKIARGRARSKIAGEWLDEWEKLVHGPPSGLLPVMIGDDERSIDMRQVSPFAGVLTEAERRAALTARRHA